MSCVLFIFFLNKIMKSKFCAKKCQENVLQFMFLYIIRTPLLELKSVGKNTLGKMVLFALIYVNTRRGTLIQPYIVYVILNC